MIKISGWVAPPKSVLWGMSPKQQPASAPSRCQVIWVYPERRGKNQP
jgi:hypothetical protein